MRQWRIGIVGGGPGGLMTAYFLQNHCDAPCHITIMEASDRFGGKIQTLQFQSSPVTYEAGAAEIYDYSEVDEDPLKDLIQELGLPISTMAGSSVIMNDHVIGSLEDISQHFGAAARDAVTAFDRSAKDRMTPREFYSSDEAPVPQPDDGVRFDSVINAIPNLGAKRFVETLIHSDLAAEPKQTNIVYGLQNYLMNDAAYMRLYSIEGGNERLPQELLSRIRGDLRLRHKVESVQRAPSGKLRIVAENDGALCEEEFDFVVLALPNNYLPKLHFPNERLATAIQNHHQHYNHPAHYLRVTILFEEAFWRKRLVDSYWMLDQFGGCCLYDESSRDPGNRHAVLGWLVAGDAARDMAAQDDETLIAAALDSLPDFLAEGRRLFREGRVHRWVNSVNAMPGGAVAVSHDRRHQPELVEHGNLFVVGDYLYDSTLNGVLDSADYVASWLTSLMLERSSKMIEEQLPRTIKSTSAAAPRPTATAVR